MGLLRKMNINVVHRYSYFRENVLHITYNALGANLTVTLQVCNCCEGSIEKSHEFRKKTYMRLSHPGEKIFVDTNGPFPESLIGNHYCITIMEYYSRYSWSFFTMTKSQLLKKMEEFFEKWHHAGLQLNTYVVTMQGNANQTSRKYA